MKSYLPEIPTDEEILEKLKKVEGGIMRFTLNDYITSSGKYPERANSADLTEEVKSSANVLLSTVDQFLTELGYTETLKISSGFRPAAVNAATAGAAKRSLHQSGRAIDIEDPDGKLDEAIKARPELLDKYGLWLEDPSFTPGWAHLDMGTRSARPIRIFIP